MSYRVLLVVFDGFELLDLAGPTSVFTTASELLGRPAYAPLAVSMRGGLVGSSSGVRVETQAADQIAVGNSDTVLVCGGGWMGLRRASEETELKEWLQRACRDAHRFGSVCAGALVLAETGCLDGVRATTHWAATDHLRTHHPEINLATDVVYVQDGRAWTSAGVATGIDMALAMVEMDQGLGVMGAVARRLVVYARRPGDQSQSSSVLEAQVDAGDRLRDVTAWLEANLDKSIRVPDLAERAGMSERTFYRRFVDALGRTPARYLEDARLERARALLEEGATVKAACFAAGYRSEASFRKRFRARLGVCPSEYPVSPS
ncbi:MAG: helix-turn-helix domain-containing protein [Myxococcota bacterium]